MIRYLSILLASVLMLHAQQAPATEDPAHEQLREVRKEMIAAIESRDLEAIFANIHPDVVVTWHNGETTHGLQALRDFYNRMGKNAFVSFKVPHQPDQLAVLHGGDTAISAGKVVANYKLLGRDYEFTSRWTATLVRQDDQWLLAAYHVSINALDNPILTAAKSLLWVAGITGLVIGVLATLLLKRKCCKA